MNKLRVLLVAAALLTAACGTASSTGSLRHDGTSIGGNPQVSGLSAASNVSGMTTSKQPSAHPAATAAATPPVIAQTVPPRTVVVPPAGGGGCGAGSGFGKVQPMCPPE